MIICFQIAIFTAQYDILYYLSVTVNLCLSNRQKGGSSIPTITYLHNVMSAQKISRNTILLSRNTHTT